MKNYNTFNYDQDDLSYNNPQKQSNIKTAIKILILILVVGLLGLGVNYLIQHKEEVVSNAQQQHKHIIDIGEIVVSLSNSSAQNRFLKVDLSIELNNNNDFKTIQNTMPVIKESFQIFLRELRVEDLNGSSGAFYVKNELLKRLNTIIYPTQVKDIFIKEIIVN